MMLDGEQQIQGPNIPKLRREGRRRELESSAEAEQHARAGKDGRPFVACSAWLGRAEATAV